MRFILFSAPLAMLLACGYVASPFWSAWALREAIRTSNVQTLERKVDWPSVRESLKTSLAAQPRFDPAGIEIKPSLWSRLTGSMKSAATNRFVERYMTPEGLPRLFNYRESLRTALSAPPTTHWKDRLVDFYSRLRRAEFQTPTRVEIEIADRTDTDRSYVSVLELIGLEWKLTGLRIISSGASGLATLQ